MTTTHEIEAGRRIDLGREVVGVAYGDRRIRVVEQTPRQAPNRIEGYNVGAPMLDGPDPHDGEMHPDGDELLYLVSGAISVRLELPDGDRTVDLAAGDALVVPQGVWHRLTLREPGRLIHITPGPNGEARHLAR